MNDEFDLIQAKIREAFDSASWSTKTMKRGIEALIIEEITQTGRPANQMLIDSCLDLLDRLNGQTYVSNKEESLCCMKTRMRRKVRQKKLLKTIPRVVIASFAIIIGSIVLDTVIEYEQLQGIPSIDQQHYQIRGHVFQSSIISNGEAESNNVTDSISIIGFEEIDEVFGFSPVYPRWLPEGWKPVEFNGSNGKLVSKISIAYHKDNSQSLMRFSIAEYHDMAIAQYDIEQSFNGAMHIWGSHQVYVTDNIDNMVAFWSDGAIRYTLSGPISIDQLERIVVSLERSEEE